MIEASKILSALGGKSNLIEVEPCITRLRVEVNDPGQVVEGDLKAAGAFGVVRNGRIVQIIVGPQADELALELDQANN